MDWLYDIFVSFNSIFNSELKLSVLIVFDSIILSLVLRLVVNIGIFGLLVSELSSSLDSLDLSSPLESSLGLSSSWEMEVNIELLLIEFGKLYEDSDDWGEDPDDWGEDPDGWGVDPDGWDEGPDDWGEDPDDWGVDPDGWDVDPDDWDEDPDDWDEDPDDWDVDPDDWDEDPDSLGLNSDSLGFDSDSWCLNSDDWGVDPDSWGVNPDDWGIDPYIFSLWAKVDWLYVFVSFNSIFNSEL